MTTENFTSPEKVERFHVVFVCFVCENDWFTSIPAAQNVIMTCPKCWNESGMRDDIVYRGLDTEH